MISWLPVAGRVCYQLHQPPKEETMQALGTTPSRQHSMRESNPHCSRAGSQFCASFLHSGGSGGTRTPDVSNVTGLQPAAFAA